MSSLFGGAKAPAPVTYTPPPSQVDPSVQEAVLAQQTAAAQAAGRQSTILTSGQGDTSTPVTGKKTLLGGG